MKTKFLWIAVAAIAFVACDKTKDGPAEINVDKPEFTAKTVTETKTDMENTGVKMVTELKTMNQDKGVKATVNLVDLVGNSGDVSLGVKKSVYFKVMSAVKAISGNKPDARVMMQALDEPVGTSLVDAFDSVAGTYTYNFISKDVDFKADKASAVIKFIFPASVESRDAKKNDGTLTIYKPKFQNGPFSAFDASVKELPTELKYELAVSGSVVSSYSFNASYQTDGIPTSIVTQLTLGEFAFKVTLGYKTSEINANWSFTHGATTIFDLGGTAGGKFSKTDFENAETIVTKTDTMYNSYYNSVTGKYVTIKTPYTYETSEIYPERVLANANAHIQFMDVKIAGKIDFTNFMADLRKAEDKNYPEDSAAPIINRHAALVVAYASDNKAIAKAQVYTKSEQVTEMEWDSKLQKYIDVTRTQKTTDVQMIFADGSKSTAETYFTDVYNKVFDEFNTFISDLNKTYKWDIAPMEKMD
jgi:hypothetical protein